MKRNGRKENKWIHGTGKGKESKEGKTKVNCKGGKKENWILLRGERGRDNTSEEEENGRARDRERIRVERENLTRIKHG